MSEKQTTISKGTGISIGVAIAAVPIIFGTGVWMTNVSRDVGSIRDLVEQAAFDRLHRTSMELWVERTARLNPDLEIPDLPPRPKSIVP